MAALSPVAGVRNAGSLFALFLDVARLLFKRPFQFREFVQQSWFVASVTIFPTMLVSIPFGAVIALELGTLARQLGAQSFTGSASVLAIIREASPIVTALLIAGAGGSAICADLGSRKIRDEIDAMEVLGISPVQRLVVPRVLATMLIAVALNGLVSVVGVMGGYFFNVVLQGGTPGATWPVSRHLRSSPTCGPARSRPSSSASSPGWSPATRDCTPAATQGRR